MQYTMLFGENLLRKESILQLCYLKPPSIVKNLYKQNRKLELGKLKGLGKKVFVQ